MSLKYNVVALESIDSAGKKTQAKLLGDCLDSLPSLFCSDTKEGKLCYRTSFPDYSTPIGKIIASKLKENWWVDESMSVSGTGEKELIIAKINALVLQSLMLTNKIEVIEEIDKAIRDCRWVVLDRYFASGLAYGAADGLDREWLRTIHSRLPMAIHVFIDITVDESFRRRPIREDAYESDRGLLERARNEYLELFSNPKTGGKWLIVDGMGTVSEVHERIKTVLGI